jgi:hypothetical protein
VKGKWNWKFASAEFALLALLLGTSVILVNPEPYLALNPWQIHSEGILILVRFVLLTLLLVAFLRFAALVIWALARRYRSSLKQTTNNA